MPVAPKSDCSVAIAARRRLVHPAGLSGKCVTADFSQVRDETVLGQLTELSTRLLTDMAAADQFTSLVIAAERGQ